MKAVRLHARGGPEQLSFEDAHLPTPGPGQVRVRVHAAAITPTELDWDQTYQFPDGKPRIPSIPGHDLSGVVETLGDGVTNLKIGDEVYGLIDFPYDGSAAEFAIAPAGDLAPKPRTLDHIRAAAVPLSALTAWQALFDHGKLQAGQRVLIHGAAGGVGAYTVQLAHRHGAHVIATASSRHTDSLRKLGVDEVIDYNRTRFEDVVRDVDLVLDPFGKESIERSYRTLRRGGKLIAISAPPPKEPADAAGVEAMFFIVRPSRPQLIELAQIIDAGELEVSVQATLPLAQARKAFEEARAGHLRGKIVLQV